MRAAGPYGIWRIVQITNQRGWVARWKALVLPIPSRRAECHTLLRSPTLWHITPAAAQATIAAVRQAPLAASSAQTIRAVLLASATVTSLARAGTVNGTIVLTKSLQSLDDEAATPGERHIAKILPRAAPRAAARRKARADTSITMRIPLRTRELIDTAAAALGKTRTEFVLDSARQHAVDVLLDRRVFHLDEDAGEAFAQAMAEPVAPNDALRSLLRSKSPWE